MSGLATGGEIVELGQATAHGLDHAGGGTGELCGGGGQRRVARRGRTGPQHEELVRDRHHAAGLADVGDRLGRERAVGLSLTFHLSDALSQRLDEVGDGLRRVLRVSDTVDELNGEQGGDGGVQTGQGDAEAGAGAVGVELGQGVDEPRHEGADQALHLGPQVQQVGQGLDPGVGAVQGGDVLGAQARILQGPGQSLPRGLEGGGELGELLLTGHPRVEPGGDPGDRVEHDAQVPGGVGAHRDAIGELLTTRHLRRKGRVLELLIGGQARSGQHLGNAAQPLLGRRPTVGPGIDGLILGGAGVAVDGAGGVEQVGAHRPGTHREVAAVRQWGDGGEDVILTAVGGEVAHVGGERAAGLEGVPHGLEGTTGHLRVTNDVVRGAGELITPIARELDEHIVRVADDATRVSGGEEELVDTHLMNGSGDLRHRQLLLGEIGGPAASGALSRTTTTFRPLINGWTAEQYTALPGQHPRGINTKGLPMCLKCIRN